MENSAVKGTLYIVSTPIGNLGDITKRAIETLGEVDFIAAEDTRHSGQLLNHLGINKKMRSYHEHNAHKVMPQVIESLNEGQSVALISDAGTPAVSDPGFKLVRAAVEQGIGVIPVPGASAVLSALVVSGLPTDRFTFEGFLPRKKGRQTRLKELATEPRTLVFYESPNRLGKTLADLRDYVGAERKVAVCREITKKFEEIIHGTLEELASKYSDDKVKGEITLVLEGLGKVKREKRNKYDSQ